MRPLILIRSVIIATLFALPMAVPCLAADPGLASSGLIDAIKERNTKLAASLIKEHADVNVAQPDGATALSWAVYLDNRDVVDLLMKAGAKPNTADEYGETPLTLASATGDFAVMKKLIDAGADPTAARWNGETALMIAARSGALPGVKLLLEHGAKIDAAESRKGQNALMWAAAEGHCEVVDFLVKSGADVKAVSKGGFTPLVFATQKGDLQSVKILLTAGLTPNYALPNGTALLHVAVSSGKPDVVEAILEHKADVDTADGGGNTPLHLATLAGNLGIVKLLLAKNANPNLLTAKVAPPAGRAAASPFRAPAGQQTALLLAARSNHEDVMRALIAAGADPKVKAQDGTTLLMAAAGSGHIGPVKYAFELDPDVSAITTRNSTVMHAAVTGTMRTSTQPEICEVIRFLAAKGADLDPEDVNGRTPIAIANFLPIDQAVKLMTTLITDSGKTPKTPAKR